MTLTGRGSANTALTSNGTRMEAAWSQGPRIATRAPIPMGDEGRELRSLLRLVRADAETGELSPLSLSIVFANARRSSVLESLLAGEVLRVRGRGCDARGTGGRG